MRMLLIGPLFATLIGCSCPPQATFSRTAASPPIELQLALFRPNPAPTKVKSTTAAKASTFRASGQLSENSDPILKKAKTTTAAKLENPASAEFRDMKRAIRKDLSGQPIDTICGYIKGKKASGEETAERPFLYLVKEDSAFVNDGDPDSVVATAYRAICTAP
jgi:hypothetical protein